MKVFLTGGTGFIGQPLTNALLARAWKVVAFMGRPGAEARALTRVGAQGVPGDITDRESMRAGMTCVEIVIHAAGWCEVGLIGSARKIMHTLNLTGTGALECRARC